MGAQAQLYCLDASACALRSEDYTSTTRWHFQRELVTVHSGAAARQPSAGVALVVATSGRASVALHPSSDAEALQVALQEVQPDGEANLEAALKLALLVSRRFPAGRTHVTAFVASSGAAASLAQHPAAAAELRQRYADAAVSLDVAVLCTSEELGAECTAVLGALTGSEAAAGSSDSCSASEGGTPAPASATRLLWLSPVDTAAESWQQLEPALEQLESGARRRSSAATTSDNSGSSGSGGGISSRGGSREQSALPRRINRAPRQYPRTSLLAARSGVQQPALCRGESLNRFGHLSSDGMARPHIPTYASLGQAARSAAVAAAAGAGSTAEMCYVEVQPLPRWRTLLKVAAGRMLPAPADGPRPGSGNYASASSELLRSLEALNVLDDEPDGSPSSQDGQSTSEDGGSSGSEDGSDAGSGNDSSSSDTPGAPAAPAVRYVPDSARGTLRLLQGTREPHLLKLVWSADRARHAPADAAASSSQEAQQPQPLDMFGSAGSSGPGSSGTSSARPAHLAHMPAATAAASAARGPIQREGCELWETAAEFDWELPLPTPEGGSRGTGGSITSPPAAFEARQLPNGAQLLMATASIASSRSSGSSSSRVRAKEPKPAAAFWLQQHLGPDSLQVPAYGTASSGMPSGEAASAAAADPSGAQPQPAQQPQVEEQQEAGEEAAGPAGLLAAALQRMLQQPPAVDLRRLRKDVKSGAIQVTPITVGPLPAQFVRDIVGARSALMSSLGMENLDSWGEGSSDGPSSSAQPGGGGGNGSSSSGASGSKTDAAGSGNEQGEKGAAAKPQAVSLQQHRSAALSLLRQRLGNLHGSKSSGRGSADKEAPAVPAEPAAADEGAGTAAGAGAAAAAGENDDTPAKATRPCSPPMATPAPPTASSCSSSVADTPFGTPMAILPSCLLRQGSDGAPAAAADGCDGGEAAVGAGSDGASHGLPSEGGQLLEAKSEGHVLVGAPSQGEAGDSEHTLFQIE